MTQRNRRSRRNKLATRLWQNRNLFTCNMEDMPGTPTVTKGERYHFIDNGGSILIVAHTDSVVTKPTVKVDNKIIACPTLDNRIGVYLALIELPLRGVKADILLTEGEETCNSTARLFKTDKKYNWIAEFDRMGFDCALYQYGDTTTRELVKAQGYTPVHGSYTDICDLEDLGVKGFNFGVAYNNYHSANSYIKIADLAKLINMFVAFYTANKDTHLPHTPAPKTYGGNWKTRTYGGYKGYTKSYSTGKYSGYYYGDRRWWEDEDGYTDLTGDDVDYDVNGDVIPRKGRTSTTMSPAMLYESERDYSADYGYCDGCETVHLAADLEYDEEGDATLCEDCYRQFYGVNSPRFDAFGFQTTPCASCGSVDNSVARTSVMGQEWQMCADCADHFTRLAESDDAGTPASSPKPTEKTMTRAGAAAERMKQQTENFAARASAEQAAKKTKIKITP